MVKGGRNMHFPVAEYSFESNGPARLRGKSIAKGFQFDLKVPSITRPYSKRQRLQVMLYWVRKLMLQTHDSVDDGLSRDPFGMDFIAEGCLRQSKTKGICLPERNVQERNQIAV
jgi:hypothetical protein